MAKVKFNFNDKQFIGAVREKIDSVLTDVNFLKEAGDIVAKDIRFQAGVGKLINDDGKLKRNDPLAESTINQRAYLARRGNATSPTYDGPEVSNLSMSGQLIKSIKTIKVDPKQRSFSVGAKDRGRRPYKGHSSTGVTDSQVLQFMIDAGRIALNVRGAVRRRLGNLLKRELRRKLR